MMRSHARYILLGLELNAKETYEKFNQLMARICLLPDFLAKTSPLRAIEKELQGKEAVFGRSAPESYPFAALFGSCWKTSQASLIEVEVVFEFEFEVEVVVIQLVTMTKIEVKDE